MRHSSPTASEVSLLMDTYRKIHAELQNRRRNRTERHDGDRPARPVNSLRQTNSVNTRPSNTKPTNTPAIHPRCSWNKSFFLGLDSTYREIVIRNNQKKKIARSGRYPDTGVLWASAWCMKQKASQPNLTLDEAVALAHQASSNPAYTPDQREGLRKINMSTLRKHTLKFTKRIAWRNLCNPKYW
jgi:hypothetical protein